MQPIPRIRRRHRAFAATLVLLVAAALPALLPDFGPLSGPRAVVAQERGAVVRGASKVFVRRGPGMSFPPFARLAEGSVVQVKGQQGEWVRIMTNGGQMGFVSAKYLLMLDRDPGAITPEAAEPRPAEAEEAVAAAPERQPTAAAERAPATVPAAQPPTPRATLTHVVPRAAAADLAASPAPKGTEPSTVIPRLPPPEPSRATMAEERAAIAEEVRRLTEAVSSLQRRIEENEPIANGFSDAGADDGSSVSGGAILLGLLGVGIGWYLGGRYGRAQERGRRSRIRF